MNPKKLVVVMALAIFLVCIAQIAIAEEGTEFNPYIGMKENLLRSIGKRISLKLTSGEPMEGTVVKVGDQNVHLAKLSGKDYYDAIVRIDRIEAIIFKTR